ncbi:hypothetical protein B0H13DRAFT_1857518 [Mycena leptocephala]|nr:hypothetical protein B0H13DRAFT_1857518 [Mycena leptocephala]
MSSQGQGERPYAEAALIYFGTGNKNELIKLVQRQISKWPGPKKSQPTRGTIPRIKAALLDPTYGFSTKKPPVASPHPPKSGSGRGPTTSVVPETIATPPLDTPAVNDMRFDPEALKIAETGRIKLFVENLGLVTSTLETEANSLATPSDGPSVSKPVVSNAGTHKPEETDSPVVKYLRERLATRDGYETFAAYRGHERLFARDYYKAKAPEKINKEAISAALGIGTTWLSNAHTAVSIIGTYGQVPDVAEVLARVDNSLAGATALFNFLTEWKKNHPV